MSEIENNAVDEEVTETEPTEVTETEQTEVTETDPTLEKVKAILGENAPSDAVLSVYLDMATNEILIWTYGKYTELTALPSWLEPIAIMAVVIGVNGNGTEGDKADTIDSVSHDFKYAEMLEYIHENAPSYVRVEK